MKKPTIYMNSEDVPLTEALEKMTDEWVDDGNYSAQTVIDLRDALIYYIKECKKLQIQINTDYWTGDIL